MEQKHTLEENGYYAQVTDQLIENIGYQMIRRNWSMKTLDDLAGRNNPALEALRRLADHADGMYQIFAEVEHLLYPNFMMQRENNK